MNNTMKSSKASSSKISLLGIGLITWFLFLPSYKFYIASRQTLDKDDAYFTLPSLQGIDERESSNARHQDGIIGSNGDGKYNIAESEKVYNDNTTVSTESQNNNQHDEKQFYRNKASLETCQNRCVFHVP